MPAVAAPRRIRRHGDYCIAPDRSFVMLGIFGKRSRELLSVRLPIKPFTTAKGAGWDMSGPDESITLAPSIHLHWPRRRQGRNIGEIVFESDWHGYLRAGELVDV